MSIKLDLAIKEFDPTKKGLWQGSVLKREIFMQLYIEKLYGNQLHYIKFAEIIILFTKEYGDYNFIQGPALLDKNKNVIFELHDLKNEYIYEYKQTNKRFTLYPISLLDLDRTDGHILYMLYDKKFNMIEVFDNTTHINNIINTKHQSFTNFFIRIYGKTIKFKYQNYGCILSNYELDYCKSDKYIYKSNGYCSIWVIWFLELKLKNKNLSSKEIVYKIKKILDIDPIKICEILIGYAQFVDKITNDYKYVVIDYKFDRISLKSEVKIKKRKRIHGIVASLIILLSSIYMFRKNLVFILKSVKK